MNIFLRYPRAIIQEIRVHQWIKNFLVFAPLFFANQFFHTEYLLTTIRLFFVFSLLASGIYVFNDLCDRKHDRLHSTKKFRSIAAGIISEHEAIAIMAILVILAIVGTYDFPQNTNIVLALYIIMNVSYSVWLKHVPIVEMFMVALMYLVRIMAGGSLFHIFISPWLILVTCFLALFLVVGKRRAEFASRVENPSSTRRVIASYTDNFLDHVMTVVIGGVILSYSLYTVEENKPFLIYTSLLVAFGMFRYLYISHTFQLGEAPEKLLFHDRWLFDTMTVWLISIVTIFYFLS